MKKTKEQKQIDFLKQENLFLYVIKSLTWNYNYYMDNYIKFLQKNDEDNAKDFKIKAKSVESRINFYERKLRRFKNLYDKRDRKYGINYGINKKIITQIIENFPEYYLHYNKKTDLKYKFIKANKDYYSHKPFRCDIRTKETEQLLLEISVSPSYINFKFYCDENNKYNLDSNVLEYILNILKINNRAVNNYTKDSLHISHNNSSVSFISSNE